MIAAIGTTMSGIGSGRYRFTAAAIPPRSAAASMVLPTITPHRVTSRTQRGRKSRMA